MQRVPEQELMLDPEQAKAYAQGDFSTPHQMLINIMLELLPQLPAEGRAADLGCGPGDMLCRLARALPGWQVDAVDGSPAMVELAQAVIANSEDLSGRVHIFLGHIPEFPLPSTDYDLIFSNSLLHHLSDPLPFWRSLRRWLKKGGFAYVADLRRPPDIRTLQELVKRYAAHEPEILRRDFYNSLRAAFTVDEVYRQLCEAGLEQLQVKPVGDRHLIVYGQLR